MISGIFAYLHQEQTRVFASTTRYLWWPATQADARAGLYSIQITFAAGPVRKDNNPVLGAIGAPVDGMVLHCTAADFPAAWLPRPDQLCLIGPADGAAPAATCQKYRVTLVSEQADYHSHIELTLARV